jgi:hypothetical protein
MREEWQKEGKREKKKSGEERREREWAKKGKEGRRKWRKRGRDKRGERYIMIMKCERQ